MRPKVGLLALCVAGLVLAAAGRAAAEPRVVLLSAAPAHGQPEARREWIARAEAQLAAELRSAGFQVVQRRAPEPLTQQALEAVLDEAQGAVLSVASSGDGLVANVWVVDPETDAIVLRRVRAPDTSHEEARLLSLRAVELLYASLLEVGRPAPGAGGGDAPDVPEPAPPEAGNGEPEAGRGEPEAGNGEPEAGRGEPEAGVPAAPDTAPAESPAPASPVPDDAGRFGLLLGGAVVGGPGGIPPAVAPVLGLSWSRGSFAGELFAVGPALSTVERTTGSARTDQEAAALRLRFEPGAPARAATLFVTAGAGAYRIGARGRAQQPYSGETGERYGLFLISGAGARLRASRRLAVVVEGSAGLTVPRAVLRFEDADAARVAAPLVLGTAAVEMVF